MILASRSATSLRCQKAYIADGNDKMEVTVPRLGRFLVFPFAVAFCGAVSGVDIGSNLQEVFHPGGKMLLKDLRHILHSDVDVSVKPVGRESDDTTLFPARIVCGNRNSTAEDQARAYHWPSLCFTSSAWSFFMATATKRDEFCQVDPSLELSLGVPLTTEVMDNPRTLLAMSGERIVEAATGR